MLFMSFAQYFYKSLFTNFNIQIQVLCFIYIFILLNFRQSANIL